VTTLAGELTAGQRQLPVSSPVFAREIATAYGQVRSITQSISGELRAKLREFEELD
jgi:hypothetical protein